MKLVLSHVFRDNLRVRRRRTRRHNRASGRALACVLLISVMSSPSVGNARARYQHLIDSAAAGGVPGLQALVIEGDREWAGVAGFASVEHRRPMRLSDRIRVASITKMFTYATILDLVRRGRLSLDDKAAERVPPAAIAGIPYADRITIRQLLEHTGGVHNFNGENGRDFFSALYGDPHGASRLWTAQELLQFARRPGNRPTGLPGEQRAYSSTGYIILELVAEHGGAAPFPELFRQFIFSPLGMLRTGVEGFDLTAREIVDSYARPAPEAAGPTPFLGRPAVRPDSLVNLSAGRPYYNAWARAAGAAASTVCDLGKFMRAVVGGRLTVIDNQEQAFAAARGRPLASFSWNGGSEGIQGSILYAPANDAIVIVLTNGTNVGLGSLEIARSLLASVRSGMEGEPTAASPAARSACTLEGGSSARAEEVRDAIRAYELAFRTGDIRAMRRAFAPNGAYLILRQELAEQLRVRNFADVIPAWSREPDPRASVEVDEISFLGERMAMVRLRLNYRGRTYLDQLSLYRFNSGWQIVAKQSELLR